MAKTIDELRAELLSAQARAEIPALSPEEEERQSLRAQLAKVQAQIEENERKARAVRDDDLFDALCAKYPAEHLERIDSEAGMIVMRAPTVAKSRHFQNIAIKGKLGPDAIEDFVKPLIVCPCKPDTLAPDADALETMLERYTLLSATLCTIAQEIGSAEAKRRAGK